MDTEHSAITEPVRRIEVFTGAGRRRTWSVEDKARIVAETLKEGESVCTVARRHGLSPQQLFGWRRQARLLAAGVENAAPKFVPAIVETPPPIGAALRRRHKRTRHADQISGLIEVEIADMTVRFGRGADVKTVAAVIRALKAGT
jgi:transposase